MRKQYWDEGEEGGEEGGEERKDGVCVWIKICLLF